MTTSIRRSKDRGHAQHGWLESFHTFSFADYHDPAHMGFRSLRVINQDRVAPGGGFPAHPHRDMEIFSYVLQGEIEHRDSLGNGRRLKPGQIQLMSAGSGVTHSEFNPSSTDPLHFLQIWIRPRAQGLVPAYTEWHPSPASEADSKVLVISGDGRDGSAIIQQDADVYRLRAPAGEIIEHTILPGRGAWLQLIRGSLVVGDHSLRPGDALCSEASGLLRITVTDDAEALLFDLG